MWLQSCFISTNHAASLNVCLMQSPERHSNSPRRLNQQAAHSHSDAIKVDIEEDEGSSEGSIQTACRSFLPSHHQNGHRLRARCVGRGELCSTNDCRLARFHKTFSWTNTASLACWLSHKSDAQHVGSQSEQCRATSVS